MAKKKKTTDQGYPLSILHKDVFCSFDMVVPLTGDLIYKGRRADVDIYVLMPNANAYERQRQRLASPHRR